MNTTTLPATSPRFASGSFDPRRMFVTAARLLTVFSLSIAGCALTGTWEAEGLTPVREDLPLTVVTFDKQHQFTATGFDEGQRRTTTGSYSWNGFVVVMRKAPEGQEAYRGLRRLDGKLSVRPAGAPRDERVILVRVKPLGR